MITALVRLTVKNGREDEFQRMFTPWVMGTLVEDQGCIDFLFLNKGRRAPGVCLVRAVD
jgi:quinol monooxygenase YgiN